MSEFTIDWGEEAGHLVRSAMRDAEFDAQVAGWLVRPSDRVAVDVGCGAGGMAAALARALAPGGRVVAVDADADVLATAREHVAATAPEAEVVFAASSLEAGADALRAAVGEPADLVWAAHSVHHAADQQAAVDSLAGLLAPGGRLALAEGGLSPRNLPWDLGVGAPGLEERLDAVQDRWFAAMRDELPGAVRMPYGWTEALRRAGLRDVTTRTVLIERPAPLPPAERAAVADGLRWRADRLSAAGLLDAGDQETVARLLDPEDEAWLGHREDVFHLDANSIHLGTRP